MVYSRLKKCCQQCNAPEIAVEKESPDFYSGIVRNNTIFCEKESRCERYFNYCNGGVARKEPNIPIIVIENYIQKLMDEWNSMRERRYEPGNMQVYNHVRAMADDLNEYCKKMNWKEG